MGQPQGRRRTTSQRVYRRPHQGAALKLANSGHLAKLRRTGVLVSSGRDNRPVKQRRHRSSKFALKPVVLALAACGFMLAACSPTFDWREVQPQGTSVKLLFPCKPAMHSRTVTLAGEPTAVVLHVCDAEGLTWALTVAAVGDPRRITRSLQELRAAAAANVQASSTPLRPQVVRGATPNDQSGSVQLQGRRPDGQMVQQSLLVFAQGLQVYAVAALGPTVTDEVTQSFFASIRILP